MEQFDVVVIGGGPGGYVAAIRTAQLGLKTACIEMRGALGGTCLNVGCIPSKALLQSTEILSVIEHKSSEHGIKVGKVEVDLSQILKRKDKIVKSLTGGIEGLFKKNKVTYYKGKGSFAGPGQVKIANDGKEEVIAAKNVIIATGSAPVELKIAPFDGKFVGSSTDALSYDSIPKRMVVVGGGYIGLEMGSVWARLGSKVTVVEAQSKILPLMDDAVSKEMKKILEKQGLEFMLGTKLLGVTTKGGVATVSCERDGSKVELEVERVLIAVGRKPYTDGLGLDKIGLQTKPDGKVEIDKHFRTKAAGVYAIGDVVDGPMLAHKAEDEGVACAEIIAGQAGHVNYDAIPGVVYTWPEIASVGLTEEDCKKKGLSVKIGQFPFMANGRAKCLGDTDGFVKVIADAKTDRVLGVHMIGPNVSEMISEAVVAFEFGGSAEDLARSTHAHPTLSETMKEACLAVDKRAIHI